MDGNCNIINEIVLVISYTTSYCKSNMCPGSTKAVLIVAGVYL